MCIQNVNFKQKSCPKRRIEPSFHHSGWNQQLQHSFLYPFYQYLPRSCSFHFPSNCRKHGNAVGELTVAASAHHHIHFAPLHTDTPQAREGPSKFHKSIMIPKLQQSKHKTRASRHGPTGNTFSRRHGTILKQKAHKPCRFESV